MRTLLPFVVFIVFATSISCKRRLKENISINQAWHKMEMAGGWVNYAPAGFVCKARQGLDSYVGYIYSKSDSITLQYDIGMMLTPNKNCDFDKTYRELKGEIDTGFYGSLYKIHTINLAYIDTIDNKLAVFIKPRKSGTGITQVTISDCASGANIGISGGDLPFNKENLILEMYKTIRLEEKRQVN